MTKPNTYWEERTCAAEGVLARLFAIVSIALPHCSGDINDVLNEWGSIRHDIHNEYAAAPTEEQSE